MFAPLFWNVGLTENVPGNVFHSFVRLCDTGCHLHLRTPLNKFDDFGLNGSRHPNIQQSDKTKSR